MSICNICSNPDILSAMRIVKIIIIIIKIVVPIALIISLMLGYLSAVKDNDSDALNKVNRSVAPKVIAAILVFFIPTLINTIANITNYSKNSYLNCISMSNKENISKLYIEKVEEYASLAKIKLNRTYYDLAMSALKNVKDENEYNRLKKELENIEKLIKAKEKADEEAKKQQSAVSQDNGWWWPIGGSKVTTVDGVKYAPGKPVATRITARFGGNDSVHQGLGSNHGAIDIGADRFSYVIASKSGTVVAPAKGTRIDYPEQAIRPDENGKYNCRGLNSNTVTIKHSDGKTTTYKHLYKNTITVRKGDYVRQGQIIGQVGSSGCSTGPHLHFEIAINGTKVDPLKYVSTSKPRP